MATLSNDLRHALMLTTGALVAVVGSGRTKEADRLNFTGEFAGLGSMSIKEVLDAADVALGCDVGLQSVAAERGRAAQAVINWLIEQTGADEAQAIMHPLVASILRPGDYSPNLFAAAPELLQVVCDIVSDCKGTINPGLYAAATDALSKAGAVQPTPVDDLPSSAEAYAAMSWHAGRQCPAQPACGRPLMRTLPPRLVMKPTCDADGNWTQVAKIYGRDARGFFELDPNDAPSRPLGNGNHQHTATRPIRKGEGA